MIYNPESPISWTAIAICLNMIGIYCGTIATMRAWRRNDFSFYIIGCLAATLNGFAFCWNIAIWMEST